MRPLKNKKLIHQPPKYKKGDIVRVDYGSGLIDFYQINGVRSSKVEGLVYYKTKLISNSRYKNLTGLTKPYNYVIDDVSRLATAQEIKKIKKDQCK